MIRIPWMPKPIHDELLSSWLSRVMLATGAAPETLVTFAGNGMALWNRDLDRSASSRLLKQLAQNTQIDALARHTLQHRYRGTVFVGDCANRYVPWVMPVGMYGRSRRAYGLQYCPKCLQSAPTYARLEWRLAFNTSCPIHNTALHDACPQCDRPWQPHRNIQFSADMRRCLACGCDAATATNPSNLHGQAFQAICHKVAIDKTFVDDRGRSFPAPTFFEGIARAARWLAGDDASETRSKLGIENCSTQSIQSIEGLRTQTRSRLFYGLGHCLKGWPERWLSAGGTTWHRRREVRDFLGRPPASRPQRRMAPRWYSPVSRDQFERLCRRHFDGAPSDVRAVIAFAYCGLRPINGLLNLMSEGVVVKDGRLQVNGLPLQMTPGVQRWVEHHMGTTRGAWFFSKSPNTLDKSVLVKTARTLLTTPHLNALHDIVRAGHYHRTARSNRPGRVFGYAFSAIPSAASRPAVERLLS